MTSADRDSLDGAPVLCIMFGSKDYDHDQYAFAARAHWNRSHSSVDPVAGGPAIAVPFEFNDHLPIIRLTGEAREFLLARSQNVELMKRLIAGSQFAVMLESDSMPAGAVHVPGLLGWTSYSRERQNLDQ